MSEDFDHGFCHTDTGKTACFQQCRVFNFESRSSGFNFQFQTKQQVCSERQATAPEHNGAMEMLLSQTLLIV